MQTKEILSAVAAVSQLWKLSNLRQLAEGRLVNNYLTLAYSAEYNTDVVLKILLWDDARTYEVRALQYFNGNRCIQLLAYNAEHHALLLPYLEPGETLRSFFPANDEQATGILVKIIQQLHSRAISAKHAALFPAVAQWLIALDKEYAQIPNNLLMDARSRAKKLLNRKSTMYLLHGDLHHENILYDRDTWISIDPKGVVGEAEYEFGAFIRNPIPDLIAYPNVQQIISRRIELCSSLSGFGAQRVADWAFVQAVLSACWVHNAGKKPLMNYFLECAAIMHRL